MMTRDEISKATLAQLDARWRELQTASSKPTTTDDQVRANALEMSEIVDELGKRREARERG